MALREDSIFLAVFNTVVWSMRTPTQTYPHKHAYAQMIHTVSRPHTQERQMWTVKRCAEILYCFALRLTCLLVFPTMFWMPSYIFYMW